MTGRHTTHETKFPLKESILIQKRRGEERRGEEPLSTRHTVSTANTEVSLVLCNNRIWTLSLKRN